MSYRLILIASITCLAVFCKPGWDQYNCPGDMALINDNICMDKYEAFLQGGLAVSKAGVEPTTGITWEQAKTACENAQKRLCTAQEFQAACLGSANYDYFYGSAYLPDRCNDSVAKAKTGQFKDCKNDLDIYDLNGNVLEWNSSLDITIDGETATNSMYGGSYQWDSYTSPDSCINCINYNNTLWYRCTQPTSYLVWKKIPNTPDREVYPNTVTPYPGVGFRCCKELNPVEDAGVDSGPDASYDGGVTDTGTGDTGNQDTGITDTGSLDIGELDISLTDGGSDI